MDPCPTCQPAKPNSGCYFCKGAGEVSGTMPCPLCPVGIDPCFCDNTGTINVADIGKAVAFFNDAKIARYIPQAND